MFHPQEVNIFLNVMHMVSVCSELCVYIRPQNAHVGSEIP